MANIIVIGGALLRFWSCPIMQGIKLALNSSGEEDCTDDFSCPPDKLPGFTRYPDEDFWRKDPIAPDGVGRGNPVSPALGKELDRLRGAIRDHQKHYPDGFKAPIDQVTNSAYVPSRSAIPIPVRYDPLVLDLDGDGIESVGIDAANPILFDPTGTGIKTATGWVKSDDAYLVLDHNGNGSIDSGAELFSDATPLDAGGIAADGFAALAQEDSNGDGTISATDARWAELRLWRDLNQDGLAQSDELLSLESQHITALKLVHSAQSQSLANGNRLADTGSYQREDGSTGSGLRLNECGNAASNNCFWRCAS